MKPLGIELKNAVSKQGCLLRAIHRAFNLLDLSEMEFVKRAIDYGALDSEFLVHHDKMAGLLTDLTGRRVIYVGFANENPGTGICFKCFSDGKLTHFVYVNNKDRILYDSEDNSRLRGLPDAKTSYRVYRFASV